MKKITITIVVDEAHIGIVDEAIEDMTCAVEFWGGVITAYEEITDDQATEILEGKKL